MFMVTLLVLPAMLLSGLCCLGIGVDIGIQRSIFKSECLNRNNNRTRAIALNDSVWVARDAGFRLNLGTLHPRSRLRGDALFASTFPLHDALDSFCRAGRLGRIIAVRTRRGRVGAGRIKIPCGRTRHGLSIDDVLWGRLVHVGVGVELEEKIEDVDEEQDYARASADLKNLLIGRVGITEGCMEGRREEKTYDT
jgi:hypothetical protein